MKRKLTFLALILATGTAAYTVRQDKPQEGISTPERVLFVLIDTVRQDRLGAYGYSRETSPTFDRLAGEGVLFLDCRSTSSWTKPAIASLFSGVGPIVHGVEKGGVADSLAARVPALPAGFETLTEAFRRNGFPTIGLSGNPHVSPQTGLDQGFDILRRSSQFGPGLSDDFLSWLDLPFIPNSETFQRLSKSPENLLIDWSENGVDVPEGVAVTARKHGIIVSRDAAPVSERACLSLPLAELPDEGGPFLIGLEYSQEQVFSGSVTTEAKDRFPIRPADRAAGGSTFLFESVAAGGGRVSAEICLLDRESGFEVVTGFVVPRQALESKKDDRWFAYLHLMNPHLPYRASQEHLDTFATGEYGDEPETLTEKAKARVGLQGIRGTDDLRVYRAHYDASIHEADQMLGAVVDKLEKQGLLAGTLIVVTSDHGEEFLDHGGMSHGADPYGELLRVPLLFYYPRALAKGKRIPGPTSLLDIYPTLVDMFGFDTVAALQGTSLLPALKSGQPMAPSDQPFVTTHTPMGIKAQKRIDVLISGNYKLTVTFDGKGGESIQLYDLVEDPGETTNLASERPQDVTRLRAEMAAERRRQEALRDSLDFDASNILLEPEDVKALQALGYLKTEPADETSDGLPTGPTTDLPLQ